MSKSHHSHHHLHSQDSGLLSSTRCRNRLRQLLSTFLARRGSEGEEESGGGHHAGAAAGGGYGYGYGAGGVGVVRRRVEIGGRMGVRRRGGSRDGERNRDRRRSSGGGRGAGTGAGSGWGSTSGLGNGLGVRSRGGVSPETFGESESSSFSYSDSAVEGQLAKYIQTRHYYAFSASTTTTARRQQQPHHHHSRSLSSHPSSALTHGHALAHHRDGTLSSSSSSSSLDSDPRHLVSIPSPVPLSIPTPAPSHETQFLSELQYELQCLADDVSVFSSAGREDESRDGRDQDLCSSLSSSVRFARLVWFLIDQTASSSSSGGNGGKDKIRPARFGPEPGSPRAHSGLDSAYGPISRGTHHRKKAKAKPTHSSGTGSGMRRVTIFSNFLRSVIDRVVGTFGSRASAKGSRNLLVGGGSGSGSVDEGSPSPLAQSLVILGSCVGKLARESMAMKTMTEWIHFESDRALEWIEEERKVVVTYVAVLLLKEIARNAPSVFFGFVERFLKGIWLPLRDTRSCLVREESGKALGAVLDLVRQRQCPDRIFWYHELISEVEVGFARRDVSWIHASLLAAGQLVKMTGQTFMVRHFEMVCDAVLGFARHKDKTIKETVISLIPRLAEFYSEEFTSRYLEPTMETFSRSLRGNVNRAVTFASLGKLCRGIGPEKMLPYKDMIIRAIGDGLTPKSRRPFVPEALDCLSFLTECMKNTIRDDVYTLLKSDLLFKDGLSVKLFHCLDSIGRNIPNLLKMIQRRLLDDISILLAKRKYRKRFKSKSLDRSQVATDADPGILCLALSILGSFDFRGYDFLDFVSECIVHFLHHSNSNVRTEAARTCCCLLLSGDQVDERRRFYVSSEEEMSFYGYAVGEMLQKLLRVAIADSDSRVRLTVLEHLHERFDRFLALSDNLSFLFIALHDDRFRIREVAIRIIGRLVDRNPAYVLSSLRRILLQLLTELEFSEDSQSKGESALMLGHLILASPRLIRPYLPNIYGVLKKNILDVNVNVSNMVLEALGKLAQVGGQDMNPFFDDLLPLLVQTLQDQSFSQRREIAVRTLGCLIKGTGRVIEPFTKHPRLLTLLLAILQSEEEWSSRREVLKVFGIIGAIDPYAHKVLLMGSIGDELVYGKLTEQTEDAILADLTPSSEEYCPTVAIITLTKILKDPTLSIHHGDVIQAIMSVFRSLGMRCVPYLDRVMVPFFQHVRSCRNIRRKIALFQQLCFLVKIVKHHVRGYVDEIFSLMKENWQTEAKIQIICLQEELCLSLNEEFTKFLPHVIPPILVAIKADHSHDYMIAKRGLNAIRIFAKFLGQYLYLVIPCVVGVFEKPDASVGLIESSVLTIDALCVYLDVFEYSSRVIHALVRLLRKKDVEIAKLVFRTLLTLIRQLKSRFLVYHSLVDEFLAEMRDAVELKPILADYDSLVTILRTSAFQCEFEARRSDSPLDAVVEVSKLEVNVQHLKRAWEASRRSANEDWLAWCRGLALELLKECPSPALRSCAALAAFYPALSRELFNAAFISCWCELNQQSQDEFVRAIKMALSSPQLPSETLQCLLNVAEFMERNEVGLPIAISSLGYFAENSRCYAKALHYKEMEFKKNPDRHVNGLISIYNKLQQHESAVGVLRYAQKHEFAEFRDVWFEELQRWEDALRCYEQRQRQDPASLDATNGIMRCLAALGQWEKLGDLTMDVWTRSDANVKEEVAGMTAHSAWLLSNWDFMEESCRYLKDDSRGNFFRSVLAVHEEDFDRARLLIDRTRELLDHDMAALVGESYTRAYDVVVILQQLVELEEVMDFCLAPKRRRTIKKIWKDRLAGLSPTVKNWRRILSIRQLVLSPEDMADDYIRLAELARQEMTFSMSSRIYRSILVKDFDPEEDPSLLLVHDVPPEIACNFVLHLWDCKRKAEAADLLSEYVKDEAIPQELLAQAFVRLAVWKKELYFNTRHTSKSTIDEILGALNRATRHSPKWSLGWHELAVFHSQVASLYEHRLAIRRERKADSDADSEDEDDDEEEGESRLDEVDPRALVEFHVAASVRAYFRSISRSPSRGKNRLRDILRLLALWFNHGGVESVYRELSQGFDEVSVDTWLDVIPQIIARIHHADPQVQGLVFRLLMSIGGEHPQALVYPLTVSSKSDNMSRNVVALRLLDSLRQQHATLVDQSLLVSNELNRVAILWPEKWVAAMEDAFRIFNLTKNPRGMFNGLIPLHRQMVAPETLSETAFQQTYGRQLQDAYRFWLMYQKSGRESDLSRAWDLYYKVHQRIKKSLPSSMKLELRFISPNLRNARDMILAVPGTYVAGQKIHRIGRFLERLELMVSRRRPRKVRIDDMEGHRFLFLLKGHEDLRLDERVTQLFGLVNQLLKENPKTRNRFLNIRRFSVIPLSSHAGLSGWVSNAPTFHALVKEYREARGFPVDYEARLIVRFAPGFELLSLMQKVEVFEHLLSNTNGMELCRMLWLKSQNSEVWLEKRTQFTRSLAVMSMVGYVLGLGDRHPRNLMMEKHTGKIVHVDFGECFEVAMHRDREPELIPFRLTRMLINTMEVCGVEGIYRSTCESVMEVLRSNKDSVMAMLEAFVYDPLINWRLIETKFLKKQTEKHQRTVSLAKHLAPDADFDFDPPTPEMHSPDHEMDGFERVVGVASSYESRSVREQNLKRTLLMRGGAGSASVTSTVSKQAQSVIKRIENKLDGRDFDENVVLPVPEQVSLLIEEATRSTSLANLYLGWCPFW